MVARDEGKQFISAGVCGEIDFKPKTFIMKKLFFLMMMLFSVAVFTGCDDDDIDDELDDLDDEMRVENTI